MRPIYLILLLHLLANSLLPAQWDINVIGQGAKPAIALDTNDIPHIAYMIETSPGFIKHAEWVTDTFISTTLQEDYYYGPLDIATNKLNQPGISVHHHNIPGEIVFLRNEMGEWSVESVDSDNHDGWDNSIAFDSKGFPHTSTVDPKNFGSDNGIEYAWKDETGWHKEIIGSVPVRYMYATSLALDREDNPHIVYYAADTCYYAYKSGGNWTIENLGEENGKFPSLALDSLNRPHIAYYMQLMGDQGVVRYATRQGGNWDFQTVETLTNVPLNFTGARRVTAIQVDHNQTVHICFGDRNVVKYGTLIEDEWNLQIIADESETSKILGAQVDLDVSSDPIPQPHITYFEVATLSPLTGTILHATSADADLDGYTVLTDCDDNDPEVNPGVEEIPDNEKDDNCDGEEANTSTSTYLINGNVLRIYPNPTYDVVRFESISNENYSVKLLSPLGQALLQKTIFQQGEINLTNFPKGIYYLKLMSLKSNEIIGMPILKQ